jgi:predicted esterase
MPQIYYLRQKVILLPVIFLLSVIAAHAQPQVDTALTARSVVTGPNSNGFYEYLPKGYVEGSTETYPLIIALHGIDELGNGTTQLPLILDDGLPQYIIKHQFPESFSSGGHNYSFIVILPQFMIWPVATDVDAVVTYAEQHYRVDKNRIYLTGLSMGGGATWSYASNSTGFASKLAAIFVVAGAQALGSGGAANIAQANLPVFATHNSGDPEVPYTTTVDNVNLINSSVPPPLTLAKDTIFDASGHDAWTKSYDPTTVYSSGLNAYQWMLQFSRDIISQPLPVSLTNYSATPAPDDGSVTIAWSTAVEQNNRYFILQRSAGGQAFDSLGTIVPESPNSASPRSYSYIDRSPLRGSNFYRLTQVDQDGKPTFYGVLEVNIDPGGKKEAFGISPNPCTDHITVRCSNSAAGQLGIECIDTKGLVIHRWTAAKGPGEWSGDFAVGDLAPGQYFIRLTLNNSREVQSFIKL